MYVPIVVHFDFSLMRIRLRKVVLYSKFRTWNKLKILSKVLLLLTLFLLKIVIKRILTIIIIILLVHLRYGSFSLKSKVYLIWCVNSLPKRCPTRRQISTVFVYLFRLGGQASKYLNRCSQVTESALNFATCLLFGQIRMTIEEATFRNYVPV